MSDENVLTKEIAEQFLADEYTHCLSINYELCFPGAVTGSAEVSCPYCSEVLAVSVEDPMGEESYHCSECSGAFEVDWGEGTDPGVVRNRTSE